MPEPEADLFRVAAAYRRSLLASERSAAVTMTRAYADSWLRVKRDLDVLQADIAAVRKAGQDVPPSWLFRAQRLPSLQRQIETELRGFADLANGTITAQQQEAVDAALSQSRQLAMTALGQPPPGAVVHWDTLPRGALTDLVGFQQDGSPLRALLDELGPEVSAGVRRELITGVAVGKNPREIARAVRKAYGLGLNRALVLSRTSTLQAYRETTHRSYLANSDVVTGWVWNSARGLRTCRACWAMHGSKHKLTERLDDHPNGRCHPAGTLAYGPRPVAASSRYYCGQLVTIRTASGKDLSFTPNHPILTTGGWVAGGLLQKGDYVVRSAGSEDATASVHEDDYQVPTRIEEIVKTLGVVIGEVPAAAEDFHGDGIPGTTALIRSAVHGHSCACCRERESFEHCPADAFRHEQGAQCDQGTSLQTALATRKADRVHCPAHGSSACLLGKQRAQAQWPSAGELVLASMLVSPVLNTTVAEPPFLFLGDLTGGVDLVGLDPVDVIGDSVPDEQAAFQGAVRRTAHCSRFRKERDVDISLGSFGSDYMFPYCDYTTATGYNATKKEPSALLGGLALSLDRVVSVGSKPFEGHVYNLQTQVGWYIANGIITHNCAMLPITATWEELLGPAGKGIPDNQPQVTPGPELFKRLTEAEQRTILGSNAAFEAYKAGAVQLEDFVGRKRSKRWGSMRYARSLDAILGREEARRWKRATLRRMQADDVGMAAG